MKKILFLSVQLFLAASCFSQLFKTNNTSCAATTNTLALLLAVQANNYLLETQPKPDESISLKYHAGFVITNNCDTINGNICLKNNNNEFSIITKRKGLNLDTILSESDVKMVRLFAYDSLLNNNPYTDFRRLDNKTYLMRQIYKGDFELYDDQYLSNEFPGLTGNYIVVNEYGSVKTLTGALFSNPRKNIIKYVNGRYSKNFTTKDFSRVIDVVNWIKLNG